MADAHALVETQMPLIDLLSCVSEVSLHGELESDVQDRFYDVPEQAASAVADAVDRIQAGAREFVAPSARAHPFGSTVNGFGVDTSDLDVVIEVDPEELCFYMRYADWSTREHKFYESEKRDGVRSGAMRPVLHNITPRACKVAASQQMAACLPEFGFRVVRFLPHAREPLVTLVDERGDMGDVDVSINNILPLGNSELLRAYSQLDSRVRPLVLLIKTWAKSQQVCGADAGNLSSYTWTIMVLYYLQLVGLLPSLQQLAGEPRSIEDSDYWGFTRRFDTSFLPAQEYWHRGEEGVLPPEDDENLTTAVLLYGFFWFFSKEYAWGSEVVSIRCPNRRAADAWFRLYGRKQVEPTIFVEDPIELRDLNVVLRGPRLSQLKKEISGAESLLASGGSLEELLSGAPSGGAPARPQRPKSSKWMRKSRPSAAQPPPLR